MADARCPDAHQHIVLTDGGGRNTTQLQRLPDLDKTDGLHELIFGVMCHVDRDEPAERHRIVVFPSERSQAQSIAIGTRGELILR